MERFEVDTGLIWVETGLIWVKAAVAERKRAGGGRSSVASGVTPPGVPALLGWAGGYVWSTNLPG